MDRHYLVNILLFNMESQKILLQENLALKNSTNYIKMN